MVMVEPAGFDHMCCVLVLLIMNGDEDLNTVLHQEAIVSGLLP